MELLFPTTTTRRTKNKRARRYARGYEADLEAFLEVPEKFKVSTYPIFGSRLASIQRKYNDSRPRTLSQFWWDRRNRSEWVALWIAVFTFLTASVLGIISSVTSIIQVILAER